MKWTRYLKQGGLADKTCTLGILLLPYDALPVMPIRYRPVSVVLMPSHKSFHLVFQTNLTNFNLQKKM